MSDTWTILKDNSALPLGDAWEHLNAQEGGSGTVVVYGAEVYLETGLIVEILFDDLYVEVEKSEYIVEVC